MVELQLPVAVHVVEDVPCSVKPLAHEYTETDPVLPVADDTNPLAGAVSVDKQAFAESSGQRCKERGKEGRIGSK